VTFVSRAGAALPLALLALGGLLLSDQLRLRVKAHAASLLVDAAFEAHLEDGAVHPPWGWADTHPVARLEAPRLGVRRTVLSGASGSSLAFGPGHVHGSASPNARGNCVLAGHRDSWFAFLEELRLGDRILLRTRGELREYRVAELRVVSMWDLSPTEATARARLTMITCYPFSGLVSSPWRYVVRSEPVPRTVRERSESLAGAA